MFFVFTQKKKKKRAAAASRCLTFTCRRFIAGRLCTSLDDQLVTLRMKINVKRSELVRALYRVQGIVEKRPTMPIAAHVLLEAEAQGLTVSATDADVSLAGAYEAEVLTPGKITVHARQLYDIVKSLAHDDISLQARDNHWLELKCGNSEFHLAGNAADEFPALPEVERHAQLVISAATLLQMIDRTLFCVSTDENRHNLAGVYCEPQGDKVLRMVSTDGHRLALAEGEVSSGPMFARGVLVPKKGLMECRRVLSETHGEGEVHLGIVNHGAIFRYNNVTLTTRLIDAAFPDYRQVIPEAGTKEVQLGRAAFTDALKRVSLLSQSRSHGVRMQFADNTLTLEAEDPEQGDAREHLPVEYSGEAITIGFNARYVLDVLALITEPRVRFQLSDDLSPGVLQPLEDRRFVSVVMPMRV